MSEHMDQGHNGANRVKVRLRATQGVSAKYRTKARKAASSARIRPIVRPTRELKAYIAIFDDMIILGHPS